MKVGVIGCGSVLKRFHLPAVRKIPEIEVKALADINEKRIKEIINKFNLINVEEYTDYRHLLKNADIDAVWILTPPKFHAKMIVEALNHGKHVLCEKPIATCIDEIEMINEVL
ncbi:MAG: Gfo/Idh/MocA family oxidoreductase, partial [Candidatus Methanomethylicia archaeon]